ncbi:uncharacterized protein PGTG_11781 [Puccinia graminis f. sp. tritici CRL 75-36-700-3]|uniref:DNA 3'-5' helicase n=1 Tax=Puccinia graminis f. sp. tritici (strain CRL 75-36-700-3 / race SCCL) TaxID=418459 RepID=E3KMA0_PUCGT|nr:uncharacterized protein PGTG_11781 [Puccinia graminis f. sp. tritici CRL 75-36-700-3]EFP85425.2 hypothetical protein PGTG_11781 [Puccinia graminis f. sp. tritici CRL 75-36-700-3]
MTLNLNTVQKIKQGAFSFQSPEVFLNSSLFTELFFSEEFQDILSLVVVDEAHMIYLWGLVASRQSKSLIIFARLEDQAVFRPGYGHLGTRLMATNNIPVLLLSATCRPVAVSAITRSLMLQPSDINMIDGELTRPEIRLIRISMGSTLSSCDDLLPIFAPFSVTSAADSVPMIIYSGTRNRTFQVMKVVNEARATPYHQYDPNNRFIRRYHSVTSDDDKARTMEDFGAGKVPVISATMALGLGQNLKRVRCVIHMGRGDPAAIGQMVGRCGRDGNVGLGLLFMEPTRKNGRNAASDFDMELEQDDDSRMDALAVTNVCLRIALNLDNKLGYIPLDLGDPKVVQERKREEGLGFAKCKCSNCAPEEARVLVNVMQQLTVANFDSVMNDPSSITKDPNIVTMTRKRRKNRPKGTCNYPKHVAEDLVNHLIHSFDEFYFAYLGPRAEFPPSVFFGRTQALAIVDSIDQIHSNGANNLTLLETVIGGQTFSGQIDALGMAMIIWTNGEYYQLHLRNISELDRFIEAEGVRVREEMAAELLGLQVAVATRRQADKEAKMLQKAQAKEVAAAARTAARMLRASDEAVERARLHSEKAAYKASKEEEKLARLKVEADARAALKAATKAQKDAERAAEKAHRLGLKVPKMKKSPLGRANFKLARQAQMAQNRAGRNKNPLGEIITEDTRMDDGMVVTVEEAPEVTYGLPAELQTEAQDSVGPSGSLVNNKLSNNHSPPSDSHKASDGPGKLANSVIVQRNIQAVLVGPKGARHSHPRVQTRNQHNVSKILREGHNSSATEASRYEMLRGG